MKIWKKIQEKISFWRMNQEIRKAYPGGKLLWTDGVKRAIFFNDEEVQLEFRRPGERKWHYSTVMPLKNFWDEERGHPRRIYREPDSQFLADA